MLNRAKILLEGEGQKRADRGIVNPNVLFLFKNGGNRGIVYIHFVFVLVDVLIIPIQGSTNHEWISNAPTMQVPREFDESDRIKSRLKTIRINNWD
jgi:hypothetical protein